MLTNMFIGDPPGNTDRILDFSTALTGSLFFVPSLELLEGLGDAGETDAGETDAGETDAGDAGAEGTAGDTGDQSLGIGSLRPAPER